MTVIYTESIGAQGETRTHTPVKAGDFELLTPIVSKRLFVEHCSFFFREKLQCRAHIEG